MGYLLLTENQNKNVLRVLKKDNLISQTIFFMCGKRISDNLCSTEHSGSEDLRSKCVFLNSVNVPLSSTVLNNTEIFGT